MERFTVLTGVAAPLPATNLDTDVIMPKVFLKGIDRSGLAAGLFHDLRYDEVGNLRPDFILNKDPWCRSKILVVGPNFGCGSSREHAVWGLLQFGVRAVIGTTFGGIFFDNCANNGLLALSIAAQDVARLSAEATVPETASFMIDIGAQIIRTADGISVQFEIDSRRKLAIVSGLDGIGLTLREAASIRAFECRHHAANPWFADPRCGQKATVTGRV